MGEGDIKVKKKFPRELAYVIGIIALPFAVAFSVKADFGVSMIAAPAYIISERVSFLSNGNAEWIVQAFFLALMCIVVKKFKVMYLASFVTAFIYGLILDFARYVTGFIPFDSIYARIVYFIIGVFLTSFSVSMFFNTYLPVCAYDYFVRTVGQAKGLDMRKWKTCFDVSMLVISCVLSLVLFKKFIGVNFGTLIIAAVNGSLISFISKTVTAHFEFYDRFDLRKYFE